MASDRFDESSSSRGEELMTATAHLRAARFQAFIDSAFDAYYDWDIINGTMEISAQLAGFLGLPPDEIPATFAQWLGLVHPDDRDMTLARNMRAVAEGTMYADEYRLRRADGTYVSVRDRGVLLKDTEGRSTHMVGAFNDVSGEREAESALREQAELYETLFKNAVNPAYQLSADGRFLDANEAGLALLDTSGGELLRRTVAELWGTPAAAAVAEVMRDTGRSTSIPVELAVGDVEKQLDVTLVPGTYHGERTCFALCTDVSAHQTLRKALERSEETLRRQKASLEDANAALRVLLDQRNRDREELERTISDNMQTLVLPLLERLRAHLADPEEISLDAAIGNLKELTRPFVPAARQAEAGLRLLTPREREIANLIRMGRTSSEIAEALYISTTTVAHHRKNLRRKLGLPPRGTRLASALAVVGAPRRDAVVPGATVGDRRGAEDEA